MLTINTNPSGPMAVRGLKLDITGIDCKTALNRKTIFENLRNCSRMHFGINVIMLYFAV
jgi:hypothetical protein